MEMLIILITVSSALVIISMFIISQDKNKYMKNIDKEIKRVGTNEYKNSQECKQYQEKIEELGLVEASVEQLFSMKQEAMKKFNVPNSFFLDEKIYSSEKEYLLKFALAHGFDNSDNIDTIYDKINPLMGYTSDELKAYNYKN
ncbi:MAG: hypothetical protein WCY51_01390 [Sulfurimonas sp.]|uniref:hypothetical protein n=1 Tax=Sulfurimonas sp. TaxID=2022749 RepID=UPI0025D8F083|nr:hypothetical protein [Sulfurimonas sp.]